MTIPPRHGRRATEAATLDRRAVVSAALGGGLAIFTMLDHLRAVMLHAGATRAVASMGSSAVLLFALPHAPLSRPWPVIGGHAVATFIAVRCARFIPGSDRAVAGAVIHD